MELQEDGAHEYLGNYNYYVEKKKNPLRFETYEGTANGKTKTAIKDEKKKKKALEKEAKAKLSEIKKLEDLLKNYNQKLIVWINLLLTINFFIHSFS